MNVKAEGFLTEPVAYASYSKKGPMDLPESSLWYMEGNAPYGIRNVDDPEPGHRPHPGFRPRPDHGPHPEGGPTPEGGPGRRK